MSFCFVIMFEMRISRTSEIRIPHCTSAPCRISKKHSLDFEMNWKKLFFTLKWNTLQHSTKKITAPCNISKKIRVPSENNCKIYNRLFGDNFARPSRFFCSFSPQWRTDFQKTRFCLPASLPPSTPLLELNSGSFSSCILPRSSSCAFESSTSSSCMCEACVTWLIHTCVMIHS